VFSWASKDLVGPEHVVPEQTHGNGNDVFYATQLTCVYCLSFLSARSRSSTHSSSSTWQTESTKSQWTACTSRKRNVGGSLQYRKEHPEPVLPRTFMGVSSANTIGTAATAIGAGGSL
jgi:hypothetical protein